MNKELLFPLNLQFFAEENIEAEQLETTTTPEKVEEEEKMFKQEDVDKIVQQRLAKERRKLEQDKQEEIEIARREAEQLAKLSAEERAKVEAEKRELAIQQREEELAQKERQFQRKQLELDTVDVLRERKLPIRFASLVLGEDAEGTLENIVKFQEEWQQELEAEVNKRLASGIPRVGSKQEGSYNPWKKDTFNLTEQGRIYKENPELAKKLKAQVGK